MQAAAIGARVYTLATNSQSTQSYIQIYDTTSNTWSLGATMPEPLIGGSLAEYGGKLYLFGGQLGIQGPTNHVFEYNPVTDTFAPKAPMPSGQDETAAVTLGNRIYVMGGHQYIHYAYNPAANSWTTIATPPTPSFSEPGIFALNGEVWVVGGYDDPTQRGYPPGQEVQIYNPTTNNWRFGPAFNTPRYYSTAAGAINGRGYVVGGIDLNSNSYPYDYLSSMESITYVSCATTTMTASPTTLASATAVNTATRTATTMTTTTPIATGSATGTILPSQTPGGPTSTAPAPATFTTLPIATSTATTTVVPTVCEITFRDVPTGDTFYTFIRCIACRGIISGYSDGTFRPGNDVTRGQLSKIVSNSAAFNDDPGPQLFEDVPVGSTFYDWVNRLANRGYISGYPCGGPGEPCSSSNLPYFRPNSNATRGQISKIVSNAAGYTDIPTSQTFEDVSPTNTFYLWIERLASRGIMGGYPCGGQGEPCGADNKPYFRWGNNATRGQTSKIVANTFFPDCRTAKKP